MPNQHLQNFPGRPGIPFGVSGSQFERPEFNEQFFSMPPEARLSTIQQFQASGQKLTKTEQGVLDSLTKRVDRRRKLDEMQAAARRREPVNGGGEGLFGSLFSALNAANPFAVVGDEMGRALDSQR